MPTRGIEITPYDSQNNLSYSSLPNQDTAYSSEWLPSVSLLSRDMRYLLEEKTVRSDRIETAIEYVDYLRSEVDPNQYWAEDENYSREQVTPRLFLDSMALLIRQQIYHTKSKKVGSNSESFDDLKNLLTTKKDMQTNLDSYVRLNPDRPSQVLFSNLWSMMNHTRRLVYNDDVINEKSRLANARNLLGMLAENKVVMALQENEWPSAEHATVEQDAKGIDVIVPAADGSRSAVVLQVKSHQQPWPLQIDSTFKTPRVVVPMNLRINDPFRLNSLDVQTLNEYIYKAPKSRWQLAA